MIDADFNEVKSCAYPGCENKILVSSESGYCEVCRTIAIRNNLAITLDPTSPISDRRDMVFAKAIHLMKPEEIINAVHKVEWAYLQLQKALKSNDLENYRKQQLEDGFSKVVAEREKPRAPKTKAKKEKRVDKLSKMLGSKDDALALLKEDFSDL